VKLALLLLVIGCSRPHYLGARVPEPCTERDIEGCLGWMAERDLHAAELAIYDDAPLRRYVQGIANRLAKGSLLGSAPRVVIADRDATYATSGRRIVIARTTIELLGSEAELAGVLAHELAHLEARHGVVSLFGRPPDDTLGDRRDAEAVADERAIWLLERSGYAPTAMARALRAVLQAEDEEHPLRADRIARVTVLAGGRSGEEARAAFLARLDRMVVGRDSRRGERVGELWIVSALGLVFELDADDVVRSADDILVLRRDRASVLAYAIGAPWGRELAASLEAGEVTRSAVGQLTIGTVPLASRRDDTPLGKLARAIRATLPQPPPGARVAILERTSGALVFELSGRGMPELRMRPATRDELASVSPTRIALEKAPRPGAIGELGVCANRLLDDPDRHVAAGEPIKCADRPLASASSVAEIQLDE
jgi:hypothetical protein